MRLGFQEQEALEPLAPQLNGEGRMEGMPSSSWNVVSFLVILTCS